MRIACVTLLLLLPGLQTDSAAQGNAQAGRTFWESVPLSRCRDCHGDKGEGGFGPDLAGRRLTREQFTRAVRKPWGIMPAFTEKQLSDETIANVFAYLQSLPLTKEPGAWRVPLPPGASKGQQLVTATVGCAQCHGIFAGPRANAGAVGADFEWFKGMVYEHTTKMPQHRIVLREAPDTPIRMGNYSPARLPESLLPDMWHYFSVELGLRPFVEATLSGGVRAGSGVTYTLAVENIGVPGKGLAAEGVTMGLTLAPGAIVTGTSSPGYQGVTIDPRTKADVAVWRLPRLAPRDEYTYTITLSGTPTAARISGGTVRWTRPTQGDGSDDSINVVMSAAAPAQTK